MQLTVLNQKTSLQQYNITPTIGKKPMIMDPWSIITIIMESDWEVED